MDNICLFHESMIHFQGNVLALSDVHYLPSFLDEYLWLQSALKGQWRWSVEMISVWRWSLEVVNQSIYSSGIWNIHSRHSSNAFAQSVHLKFRSKCWHAVFTHSIHSRLLLTVSSHKSIPEGLKAFALRHSMVIPVQSSLSPPNGCPWVVSEVERGCRRHLWKCLMLLEHGMLLLLQPLVTLISLSGLGHVRACKSIW